MRFPRIEIEAYSERGSYGDLTAETFSVDSVTVNVKAGAWCDSVGQRHTRAMQKETERTLDAFGRAFDKARNLCDSFDPKRVVYEDQSDNIEKFRVEYV